MKRIVLVLMATLVFPAAAFCNEGMWLPILVKGYVEGQMKDMGMRITADDIYSINNGSLKDAVMIFGGGCTSELVSGSGLILTNHHCGYGQIQSHTTLENDYLKNGFWAKSLKEELPNKGLTATRIVRIEDVTAAIFAGTRKEAPDQAVLDENIKKIAEAAMAGTHFQASVVPFYYGNEYYLFVVEVFKDVRLVGAPPSSIGKFGGDTDNWMWPRHTGDFSVFRVYAGPDNKPAEYAETNVPYKPYRSFDVSMKGVTENDFTMVYGFPGQTQEYLTSYGVEMVVNVQDPIRIAIRKASLEIIDAAMASSDDLRIKYAAKQSRISNGYKKWIGELSGLERLDAIAQKQELEQEFKNRSANTPYQGILDQFKSTYEAYTPYATASTYFSEFLFAGPEILRLSYAFQKLATQYSVLKDNGELDKTISNLKATTENYFKNYDAETDRKIFETVFPVFYTGVDKAYIPEHVSDILQKAGGDYAKLTSEVMDNSVFKDKESVLNLLAKMNEKNAAKILDDPAYKFAASFYDIYFTQLDGKVKEYNLQIKDLMAVWMRGLLDLLPKEKKYYADANSTLRVSFGKVEGSEPRDGVIYNYFTTIDGIMEKYIPGDIEFDLDAKFIELYEKRDFAPYGDSTLVVAFTASNHTTGGNSGSPVLNADGQLIGINFDRSWESTMSDIMYDPERCRNIIVDIRYVLWTIDKVGNAKWLINEMNLVK